MSDHSIHVLDKDTINKIAAGEVIERPASVVKELVDNAIDAGAQTIRVELKDSGKTFISVRDDGKGMSRDDAVLSPVKHATSKISGITDLETIATMGFRGEALAAISSVSKFEIITKRREDATGTRLYLEDEIRDVRDIGAPDGTTVSVDSLFYNTPARLKYMKSDATELSHITSMVGDLILANPGISLTLINNGKTVLSSGSSNLFNSVTDVLGPEAARLMIEIPSENMKNKSEHLEKAAAEIQMLTDSADLRVFGYISKPTYNKSTAESLYFIVNGRPVTSKELIKAVRLGYYTKLPKDRYPAAVISLQINPKEVDVNVHPRKIEVRFRDENKLVKIISQVIEITLRSSGLAPQMTAADSKKVVEKSFSDFGVSVPSKVSEAETVRETKAEYVVPGKSSEQTVLTKTSVFGNPQTAAPVQTESIYTAPAKDTERRLRKTERLLSQNPDREKDGRPTEISILDDIRIVGQISNLYLLAEKDGGLLIIDQHAAHERIFYDLIKKQENVSVQELISPVVVHLSPKEKVLMEEYIPYLEEIGFGISEFGDCSYAVSFVPVFFGRMEDISVVHDFIADLLSYGKIKDETGKRDTVAKRTACRAAIKAGAVCNQQQIDDLIRQLKRTENPYSCPHGRPTILVFSKKEIEKMFERS